MPEERIVARGHEHVTARHESTLELTTDTWLTPAGDCIVGIGADRAPTSFDRAFTNAAQSEDATLVLELSVGERSETVRGRGHSALTFESDRCMIVRTSSYVDDRTIMIHADKAAADLNRDFVNLLAAGAEIVATLRIES